MHRILGAALWLVALSSAAAVQSTPRITGIEFGPPPADGSGITIAVVGTGECSYTIDFGDGTTERRTAKLPDKLQHGYKEDNAYDVVARPDAPCEGVARARIDIRPLKEGISRLTVEAGAATDAPEVIVTIDGRGTCTVTVDFGDGKTEKVEGTLPAKVSHTYGAPGAYELRAVAERPCQGDVRLKVEVSRQPSDE